MRKLTVRNFSVIKEAELEFGKITVLIGPQASGKSLLCKLAYFFEKGLIDLSIESVLNGSSWDDFTQAVLREFGGWFSTNGWLRTNSRASFSSHRYEVIISGEGDPLDPKITIRFCSDFVIAYNSLRESLSEASAVGRSDRNGQRAEAWTALRRILAEPFLDDILYIPAGRAFFTDMAKGIAALQNPEIDPLVRHFAGIIAWDTRWKVGLLSSGAGVTQAIEREMNRIAGGEVEVSAGIPRFLTPDGRSLSLGQLSSGTSEVLPLFNVLNRLAYLQENRQLYAQAKHSPPLADSYPRSRPLVYLEEPEAHIFPNTQLQIVRLFAWLANDPILSFQWVITTHSPYILTAFNALIYAGQLANRGPELKEEVAKLVPKHLWIEDGSFKAYCIRDGVLKSILSESGLIDGEYLDSVSDTIEHEFDSLLRLEYDHTEAS